MAFTTKDWKDYPDTTTPLSATAIEDLEKRVTDYSANNFLQLAAQYVANDVATTLPGTNVKIAFGSVSSLSFTQPTNQRQFGHTLGTTPKAMFVTGSKIATGSGDTELFCAVTNVGASTFDCWMRTGNDATPTGTCTVYWMAIG